MSDLWDVDILNRGQSWVDLKVTLHHPDAGPFPESPGFALQLLLIPAFGWDSSGNRRAPSPLSSEWSEDNYYDAEECSDRAKQFVRSVKIYRAVNVPFIEKQVHEGIDKRVLARGIARDSDDWESEWEREWRAYWSDPGRVPSATYRIEVTDPRFLSHIEPGMRFDSASWCPTGPWLKTKRNLTLPTPPDAWLAPWLIDFPLADKPRGVRQMDPKLIESLAASGPSLAGQELAAALAQHKQFLDAGNREGDWQLLSVSGLPLCIYQVYGQSEENKVGAQLVLRMKQIPVGESLHGRDIGYADLSGSICRGVDFGKAVLDGCAAVDAFFDGAKFDGASLRKIDFSGSSLRGCSFVGADLRGADFEHTDLTGSDFSGAILTGARFPGAILDAVKRDGVVAPTPARTDPVSVESPVKKKPAARKSTAPKKAAAKPKSGTTKRAAASNKSTATKKTSTAKKTSKSTTDKTPASPSTRRPRKTPTTRS